MTGQGRREVHKRATREALMAAARTMFAERGYDGTTVRDIADAANVTERTFFRYFASKEDLVFGEVLDLLPVFARAVVAQPSQVPPLSAIRDALLGLGIARPALGLLFSGPPILRNARQAGVARGGVLLSFESGLADAVEERLAAAGGSRFQAEVVARAAIGALRSCLVAYHLAGGPAAEPLETLGALIVEAFGLLGA